MKKKKAIAISGDIHNTCIKSWIESAKMKKLLETYKKELKETGKVIFKIKVIAKAPKTMFRDVMQDNTIKLAVAQVAEKGKANEEICSFLAKEFVVTKREVSILSGKSAPTKLIQITKEKL